jgi:hypothetical protein
MSYFQPGGWCFQLRISSPAVSRGSMSYDFISLAYARPKHFSKHAANKFHTFIQLFVMNARSVIMFDLLCMRYSINLMLIDLHTGKIREQMTFDT